MPASTAPPSASAAVPPPATAPTSSTVAEDDAADADAAAAVALPTDYYRTLGIERSADYDTVRKAYRRLALKYHPERNKSRDAPEAFRRVSESYDVLSNSEFEGFFGGYAYHGNPEETFAKFFGGTNPFADFFAVLTEEMPTKFGPKFGGLHGMNSGNAVLAPPTQDPPIEIDIPVTLEELYIGVVKKARVTRRVLTEDGITTEEQQKIFTINIMKGWKDGTSIKFPKEGHQGPNKIPGTTYTLSE
ncbi:hypothetical protein HK405_016074 [Cladochytrium tenue]|nr:hypothetical protein HK405_016074 [Cladochytrium tenue]